MVRHVNISRNAVSRSLPSRDNHSSVPPMFDTTSTVTCWIREPSTHPVWLTDSASEDYLGHALKICASLSSSSGPTSWNFDLTLGAFKRQLKTLLFTSM